MWRIATLAIFMFTRQAIAAGEFDQTGQYTGSYACTPEAAAGISYDLNARAWAPTGFRVGNTIFYVRVKPTGSQTLFGDSEKFIRYEVQIGDRYHAESQCMDFSDLPRNLDDIPADLGSMIIGANGSINCAWGRAEYDINLTTLRYVKTYTFGFSSLTDNTAVVPYIEIGNCISFR